MYIEKNKYLAVILTLLAPFIGMLNISEGKKSIFYFIASILSVLLGFIAVHNELFQDLTLSILCFKIPINIIATIHCYRILKLKDWAIQSKLYSSWYAIIIIIALLLCNYFIATRLILLPSKIVKSSMQPDLEDDQYVLSINAKLYHFLQKILNDNDISHPKKGDIVIYHFDDYAYLHHYYVGKVISKSQITNKEFKESNTFFPYYKECNLVNFVKNECIFITVNKSQIFWAVPRKKIDGYVKYIIWDQNKKKFIMKITNS